MDKQGKSEAGGLAGIEVVPSNGPQGQVYGYADCGCESQCAGMCSIGCASSCGGDEDLLAQEAILEEGGGYIDEETMLF